MTLIEGFIRNVGTLIRNKPDVFTPSLFTDQRYLSQKADMVCHKLVIEILKEAGRLLPTVAHVSSENKTFRDQGNRKLHGGWKPDIILEDASGEHMQLFEHG